MSRATIFSFVPILTKILPESITCIERGRYYRYTIYILHVQRGVDITGIHILHAQRGVDITGIHITCIKRGRYYRYMHIIIKFKIPYPKPVKHTNKTKLRLNQSKKNSLNIYFLIIKTHFSLLKTKKELSVLKYKIIIQHPNFIFVYQKLVQPPPL